jgi:hypothetical protein
MLVYIVALFLPFAGPAFAPPPKLAAIVANSAIHLDLSGDAFEYLVRQNPGTIRTSGVRWMAFPGDRIVLDAPLGTYQLRSARTATSQAKTAGIMPSAFPDANNTGVPPDALLTPSRSVASNSAAQIIENLDITGYVEIKHDNVVLRKCRVTGNAVIVRANNVTIEDCTIDVNFGWNSAIVLDGVVGAKVRRNNISRTENGVFMSGSRHLVEDNYIHDLWFPSADPHIDGIQLFGGITNDVIIRHNSVIVSDHANAAITMGTVQNVQVDNNRLHGGGYTVVVDGRSGAGTVARVYITNNRFGPHVFGYMTFERASPVMSGNVDDLRGASIP